MNCFEFGRESSLVFSVLKKLSNLKWAVDFDAVVGDGVKKDNFLVTSGVLITGD